MPTLNISTNVSLEGFDTSAFLAEATPIVAELAGKPLHFIMIILKGSVSMSFAGTEEPTAYGEFISIGGFNADVNKKISATISGLLETKLNVPKNRFFLKIYDSEPSFVGWNGTTF